MKKTTSMTFNHFYVKCKLIIIQLDLRFDSFIFLLRCAFIDQMIVITIESCYKFGLQTSKEIK